MQVTPVHYLTAVTTARIIAYISNFLLKFETGEINETTDL